MAEKSIEIGLTKSKFADESLLVGFLNPLIEDIECYSDTWRYMIVGTGDLFIADAHYCTHHDMVRASVGRYSIYGPHVNGISIGYFIIRTEGVYFGVIQHVGLSRAEGFKFLGNLIPVDNFLMGRPMILMKDILDE